MFKKMAIGILCAATMIPAPISVSAETNSSLKEQKCIANNIYWEARNQTVKGMIGVALVTRNRVSDNRFPNSYCDVVYQGPTRPTWRDPSVRIPVKHRCQFSWYCDGKPDNIPSYDNDLYTVALAIAYRVYYGKFSDFTLGATHYHATYVLPAWAKTKTRTTKVGRHIFYRWEK